MLLSELIMAEKEGKPLLQAMESLGMYGEESSLVSTSDSPPPYDADNDGTEAATKAGEEAQKKRPTKIRDRIKRKLSLEKVDEESHPPKSKFGCQNLSSMFGVKSYLHHFYESHSYKDPDMYEDEEEAFRYLLRPRSKRRRCTSIWWKVFVWIGANFLVFGVVGVLVGYLVPQRPIIVGAIGDNIKIMDKQAIPFNFNLDVCKLVGLILFCIGGLTLTVALLFPSFLYHYCGDDERRDQGAFRVTSEPLTKPPLSPLDRNIPVCSTLTNVQPDRKSQEAILTQEGMLAYKD